MTPVLTLDGSLNPLLQLTLREMALIPSSQASEQRLEQIKTGSNLINPLDYLRTDIKIASLILRLTSEATQELSSRDHEIRLDNTAISAAT